MKKEIGKGPMIAVGVVAVVVIGYFAFKSMQGPTYDSAEQSRNEAQRKISDQQFDRVNQSIDGQAPAAGQ